MPPSPSPHLLNTAGSQGDLWKALESAFANLRKGKNEKSNFRTFNDYAHSAPALLRRFPSGRAPYARPVMRRAVVDEVLGGQRFHPLEGKKITDPKW